MSRPYSNHRHRRSNRSFRSNAYIRRCKGFGKFEGCDYTDVFAYDASLATNEFCSNEHWGNSASLVEGPFHSWDLFRWTDLVQWDNRGLTLNRAERRFIKRQVGAIVSESSSGFINVEWFDNKQGLQHAWALTQEEYYPDESEIEE